MLIFSVDPGYDRLGVAILDSSEGVGKEILVFSDCVETNTKDNFSKRILDIYQAAEKIINGYKPGVLAIESLYLATNKKTAMRVAEARGVIILSAEKHGLPIFEYSPPEIKMAVTGHGGSSKKQVEAMVKKLIGFPKDKKTKDDELDAVAIGLTHSAMFRAKTSK